jgi:hypothetical protein
MPAYFRFGFGPLRFSQRLGRTRGQQKAAAQRAQQRTAARAYDRQSFTIRGITQGAENGFLKVRVPSGQYTGDWAIRTSQTFDDGQWAEFRFKGRYARNTGQGWYRVSEAKIESIDTPPEWIAEQREKADREARTYRARISECRMDALTGGEFTVTAPERPAVHLTVKPDLALRFASLRNNDIVSLFHPGLGMAAGMPRVMSGVSA